jgi:hypothetical protein
MVRVITAATGRLALAVWTAADLADYICLADDADHSLIGVADGQEIRVGLEQKLRRLRKRSVVPTTTRRLDAAGSILPTRIGSNLPIIGT